MKILLLITIVIACGLPNPASADVAPSQPDHDQLFWTLSLVNVTLASVNALLLAKGTPKEIPASLSVGAGVVSGIVVTALAASGELNWDEPSDATIVVTSAVAIAVGVLGLHKVKHTQPNDRVSLGLVSAPSGPPRAVGLRIRF